MMPAAKKKRTEKTKGNSCDDASKLLTLEGLGCDILFHQILPFLATNDQTNFCLVNKSMLANRDAFASSTHGGTMIVWEARAPTKRAYGVKHGEDINIDNSVVTVRQEQCFRFQLHTAEYGHLVVRIHLQNDLWDEYHNSQRDGLYCRAANDFPTRTLVSVVDIFQPPKPGFSKYYRLLAMEINSDGSVIMIRTMKERKARVPYHILPGHILNRIEAPQDGISDETKEILRSSLQYLWLCARRVESWTDDDDDSNDDETTSSISYPTAEYIMDMALPPWLQQRYGPEDYQWMKLCPDRQTHPEFTYRPAPSLQEWKAPNLTIFEGGQNDPRPWEA